MRALIISAVIIILLLLFGLIVFNNSQSSKISNPVPTPTPTFLDEKINLKASFTIITGNIIRSFKAEKYHNQSSDVYIQSDDPTTIHVKKAGVTYDDFFKTLPMKLTSDCLVAGDGETLCSGSSGTLKFYLNDTETPDLLEKQIKEGDKALIKFIY